MPAMQTPEMEQLVVDMLDDRQTVLRDYFTARSARLDSLIWNPTSTDTGQDVMRFLIEYWHQLRGDAAIPQACDVSPFELKPALGHIVLIDVLDEGWDGRFRLYGTKVAETYGRDMTGRLISEIDGGNYVSVFFRALYRAAWLRRAPYYSHHFPPAHVAVESWQRLALPLAGPDGQVSRFLACNIAGPWRPPAWKSRTARPETADIR
ncbi:PAS domain-containing protein [Ferrovibrio terrae]|uniref:PAS domain-containing protein n=2 Tax=Ferrovibrio terrae TaxID=2594003 RepID=A0A516H0L5_9PROT|nr:PAS domain-containing protein [Ferrovibrio terrae]